MNRRCVLVLLDERSRPELLRLAADLAGQAGGLVIALMVVEVPLARHPVAGASAARAARHALRRLIAEAGLDGRTVQARVRAARDGAAGVREVADEERPDLLLLAAASGALSGTARDLLGSPPCDMAVARVAAGSTTFRSVLVPARGGPTAELAFDLGLSVATREGAQLTLLHLDAAGRSIDDREQEERLFRSLLGRSDYPRLRSSTMPASDIAGALLAEAVRHQLTIAGAAIRPEHSAEPLGPIAEALLARGPGSVIIVKPRRPVDAAVFRPRLPADVLVDKWFMENTFHGREFANVDELVRMKRAQDVTVSVALMAAGDSAALPAIARVLNEDLGRRSPLVDEVGLFVSEHEGQTASAARALGLPVHVVPDGGRGRMVWESLRALRGDLIVWLDTDIRNIHARFVYGLVGPLLREPRIALVTGFYRLPETLEEAGFDDPQVQATELAARPLLNLYFPELSGLINPLAQERAARRQSLAGIRLPAGDAAGITLVLDVFERDGLRALAQSDLEERIGRNARVTEVTRHAFATIQALTARLIPAERPQHAAMKVIHHADDRYFIEVVGSSERLLAPVAPLMRGAAPATVT